LAQQFAAGILTVSTVNDSPDLRQFHFVNSVSRIDSRHVFVLPLAHLARVFAFEPEPISVACDLDAGK
jgi:hypothetical protein